MDCDHESENSFNLSAIKLFIQENGKEKIVEHLPQEIYRPTKFLLDIGAVMHAEILTVKYRNPPMLQGGLELSCIAFVSMPPAALNESLIGR